MAKPRVFISSTCYDLKHIRSSAEAFVLSLGFEPILSEKGHIAFNPDTPLDESCYREVGNSDIYVMIIGGRYGSERSGQNKKSGDFYSRYHSVTREEYASACSAEIPIYILIDRNVYSEYRTYQKNKHNETVQYAHVDSVNVFHLIEEILSRRANNPIHEFERFADMEVWLREQWSGYFRELLGGRKNRARVSDLATQISTLTAVTETLKAYVEEIVKRVSPDDSQRLIQEQETALADAIRKSKLLQNRAIVHLTSLHRKPFEQVESALAEASQWREFIDRLGIACGSLISARGWQDTNEARELIGKPPFPWDETPIKERIEIRTRRQRARVGIKPIATRGT